MPGILVIGASGDVGQGIVAEALAHGHRVVATGRRAEKLERLAAGLNDPNLSTLVGDIGTEADALSLWTLAQPLCGSIEAVVVSVNAPNTTAPILDRSPEELSRILEANVLTHFVAAKTFLPRLPEFGLLIGIGGGTADFVLPGLGQLSMAQAALRMMYRAIARDRRSGEAQVRELMVISMVNGETTRAQAKEDWLTDRDIGRHVCAILADPGAFAGPILALASRAEAGRPPAAGAP